MKWNPILLWLLVFTGVAVQASVVPGKPVEETREVARECHVYVSGHARLEMSGITADAISLIAEDHARIEIEELISTSVEASSGEYAKVELKPDVGHDGSE